MPQPSISRYVDTGGQREHFLDTLLWWHAPVDVENGVGPKDKDCVLARVFLAPRPPAGDRRCLTCRMESYLMSPSPLAGASEPTQFC